MIAVDASVVIDLLLGPGSPGGDTVAALLSAGDILCAPHLIDAEVGQGLRRYVMHGDLTGDLAESLVRHFLEVPITRYPHTGLLSRAFELRSTVTVYDGLYLALAEILECPLVTGDGALRNVPGSHAVVEVLPTSA